MDYYAKANRVELLIDLGAESRWVHGTELMINEIFMNLIKNAMESTRNCDSARVTIRSRAIGNEYVVSVTDTGIGIPQSQQESIFEPFVTHKADGTGLGLYIVGQRVRELNGRIEVESELGRGTCFRVRLPLL
jgi:signal transduction histidine kinase